MLSTVVEIINLLQDLMALNSKLSLAYSLSILMKVSKNSLLHSLSINQAPLLYQIILTTSNFP